MLRQLSVIAFFLSIYSSAFAQEPSGQLQTEIDKMLEAVGGRDVWRDATGFTMSEILHSDQRELPILREYWVDFDTPRIMETAKAVGLRQTRALNRDTGWTSRDGSVTEWEAETVEGWKSFWPGIPTRIFHLLASDDPSLSVTWRDGVMDFTIDGQRVVWIATNEEGIPVAYGRENRHSDTHFLGKMLAYGDVNLWSEAIEPGDDWRVVMIDYTLLKKPHTISFEPPAP